MTQGIKNQSAQQVMSTEASQAQQTPKTLSEWRELSLSIFGNENGEVTYDVAGQKVKLNYYIIQKFITKGGGTASFPEILQFIQLCKLNQLNPFLNEAYFVKFGTTDVQMVVSKEALLKRAEANPHYNGYKAGIIISRARDGEVIEVEGTFMMSDDKLLGGWAVVYRDDRREPIKQTVALDEYDKNRSTWNTMKKTMIRKVALCQALREAFPAQLGAIYTEDESRAVHDIQYEDVTDRVEKEVKANANGKTIEIGVTASDPKDNAPQAEIMPNVATENKREMPF